MSSSVKCRVGTVPTFFGVVNNNLIALKEWIKKMWYTYNGLLLSYIREWSWDICRDMDGPRGCHTEWNKSEREKLISAYMCDLEKWYGGVQFSSVQSLSRVRLFLAPEWLSFLLTNPYTMAFKKWDTWSFTQLMFIKLSCFQ